MKSIEGPIDSRQLLAFVHLTHGGSLKAAARELTVTESAISHAIRNLETSLEAKLFKRNGKGLVLTDSGNLLLAEAIEILARMRDIRTRIHLQEGDETGEIRIVSATSFIRSFLHDVLSEFRYCFPSTEISVTAADRKTCIQSLAKGEADAAILVNLPSQSDSIRGKYLFSDDLRVLMSTSHPLARYPVIPLHALCRERIYMRQQENFTANLIQQEIARRSFQIRNTVHINSFEAATELVRLGMGVTFQTPWALRFGPGNEEFTSRKVEELDLRRDWHFAWPANRTMDLRMKTLLRLCEFAGFRISQILRTADLEQPLGTHTA